LQLAKLKQNKRQRASGKKADAIINQVHAAVSKWDAYANQTSVTKANTLWLL
jgi:hypothetical protein